MRTRARRLPLVLGLLALAARAGGVEPGFRVYVDEFPLAPLQKAVFGFNAGSVPLSSLTTQGFPDAVALEAAPAWDFSPAGGFDRVVQFAPVDPAWSCYVPTGCGGIFDPSRSDLLFAQDNYDPPQTRDVSAIDFNGVETFYMRAQALEEGSASEVRTCLTPDVPFLVFVNPDGARRFMADGDPAWGSAKFDCVQAVTQGGPCGTSGTDAYLSDGNGTTGRMDGRVVRSGTLTLPSGHVVDTLLVEVYASFEAYGAKLFGACQIPAQRLRTYLLMWLLPHHGPIAQLTSGADTPDLASFTSSGSTVLGYGLLPPVSIQVDAVTANSITVSWDPGKLGGFPPDSYVVHWGDQPGSQVPPPFSDTTAATTYTIGGLAPGMQVCVSVSSRRSYTDPRSNVTTVYESIALPTSVGADVDGDGVRDTSYPPEACVTIGAPVGTLRRNDQVTSLTPVTPALSTIFPLDAADDYVPNFVSGNPDPEAIILVDANRPLVFYAIDPPKDVKLVKSGGSVRIY